MTEENPTPRHTGAAVALVETRKIPSLIWVVPVVALLIGGWLAFKTWAEKGPEITISFEAAEGLEANKTKIKFKDVEVGIVTAIKLKEDLSGVVVTAAMNRDAQPYLTDQTDFWVVRARVAAGEVSGLGTLFSGAYIGCNPSRQGQPTHHFTGLEKPPVVTTGMPGRHFVLTSATLGSLDIGSPVYYRGIKVGQVVGYDFNADAESVNVRIFVSAPFHEKVTHNTRFWNASGIDFSLDTQGVKIDTQSLVSIMLGGVAFDLPQHLDAVHPAAEGEIFKLYGNQESSREKTYSVKRYYLLYFEQNVRGLAAGAPVELKGIRLGEVVDVKLEIDADDLSARIAVVIMIEPERIDTVVEYQTARAGAEDVASDQEAVLNFKKLVGKGLRAQLKTGNLLTGQLYVELGFHKGEPAEELKTVNGYLVLPTVAAPLEKIIERVDRILAQFEQVPFAKIGSELSAAMATLTATMTEVKTLSHNVNDETLPRVNAALEELRTTLQGVEATLGADSALGYNARMISSELAMTIRSIRSLLDYLERNPQALIFGKEGTTP